MSPDNTRIAFKKLVSRGDGGLGPLRWRVSVLDLETLEDKFVADTRNVDDQVEWLDDDTVLYAVDDNFGPLDTWAAPADGSGKPRLFIQAGDSPTVVRDPTAREVPTRKPAQQQRAAASGTDAQPSESSRSSTCADDSPKSSASSSTV